jgi:hypothetical protein
MSSIPVFHYQINTDNLDLIGNLLEKENFLRQNISSTFIKSNFDYKIHIDLSRSFESPSIICCYSTISLPELLSFLNSKSISIIHLILFIKPSDSIDWNSLISLITTYNLSLNIVNDENDFSTKLTNIIHNLAQQNISKKSISININKHQSLADIQVNILVRLNYCSLQTTIVFLSLTVLCYSLYCKHLFYE